MDNKPFLWLLNDLKRLDPDPSQPKIAHNEMDHHSVPICSNIRSEIQKSKEIMDASIDLMVISPISKHPWLSPVNLMVKAMVFKPWSGEVRGFHGTGQAAASALPDVPVTIFGGEQRYWKNEHQIVMES